MEASSMQFAAAARVLADAARALHLHAPSFRSPPRARADRTVRGSGSGSATVAVRMRQRSWFAVLADLIEGVVVVNELTGREAEQCRNELWAAVERERVTDLPTSEPRTAPQVQVPRRDRPTSTVDGTPGWRKRHTQAA